MTTMKKITIAKIMIANIFLTSSLIILTILQLTDRSLKEIMMDQAYSFSSELSGNGTEVYLYGKKAHRAVDVGALCANMETHKTQEISVWKTQLNQPILRHMPTDLDVAYHAYIVFETEDPMGVKHYWSQVSWNFLKCSFVSCCQIVFDSSLNYACGRLLLLV